jgi:hypothetical protein
LSFLLFCVYFQFDFMKCGTKLQMEKANLDANRTDAFSEENRVDSCDTADATQYHSSEELEMADRRNIIDIEAGAKRYKKTMERGRVALAALEARRLELECNARQRTKERQENIRKQNQAEEDLQIMVTPVNHCRDIPAWNLLTHHPQANGVPDYDVADYPSPEIVVGASSVGEILIASVNGFGEPSGAAFMRIEDAN